MDIIDMNCCTGGEPGGGGGKCSIGAGDELMPMRPSDIGIRTLRLRAAPIYKARHQCNDGSVTKAPPLPYQSTRCHVNGATDAVKTLGKKHRASDSSGSINGSLDSIGIVAVAVSCNRWSRVERESSKHTHTPLAPKFLALKTPSMSNVGYCLSFHLC
jgi:hypothetical protein